VAGPPALAGALSLHADGYRAGTRQAPHRHDELHLSLVLSGHVAESVGAATEFAAALSVVAKDAGVRHANDFGRRGARLARLALRGGTLGALVDRAGPATGWRWSHDPRVAAPFLRLVARRGGASRRVAPDDPDLLDLLAALTARPAPPPRGCPPAWLAETWDAVRAEWTPRLRVAEVARRAGVHPVYLARSVRRWYGTGVGQELRRLRLRAALARLADGALDPGITVSHVAHAAGFADEPHLCRALRSAAGITPGRYRSLVARLPYQWRGGM
jgi:AraC family transcriptional regulator